MNPANINIDVQTTDAPSFHVDPIPASTNICFAAMEFIGKCIRVAAVYIMGFVAIVVVIAAIISTMIVIWFPLATTENPIILRDMGWYSLGIMILSAGIVMGSIFIVMRVVLFSDSISYREEKLKKIKNIIRVTQMTWPNDNAKLATELEKHYPQNFTGSYMDTLHILSNSHGSIWGIDMNLLCTAVDGMTIIVNLIVGLIIFLTWPATMATYSFIVWLCTFAGSISLIIFHWYMLDYTRLEFIKMYNGAFDGTA